MTTFLAAAVLFAQTVLSPTQLAAPDSVKPCPQGTLEVAKGGTIKGVVTYVFNDNIGEKEDVGSQVYLIAGKIELPDNRLVFKVKEEMQIATPAERIQAVAEEKKGLPFPRLGQFVPISDVSRVDANGTFRFDDVPGGSYTVVIASSHSNGTSVRDHFGRWQCVSVEVKANRAIDASVGFSSSDH